MAWWPSLACPTCIVCLSTDKGIGLCLISHSSAHQCSRGWVQNYWDRSAVATAVVSVCLKCLWVWLKDSCVLGFFGEWLPQDLFSSHTCVRNFKLWKHLSGGSWFCALGALFHCSPSFIKRTPGYLSAVRTKALYCAYRIYMDIMWSQIFTVLGSQPVNWPAGRYLSRTCIGLR